MSWLDDLATFGSAVVDKAIDYETAVANNFAPVGTANATTADPIIPVEVSPLGAPGDFTQYLPWVAAGVAGLVLVYVVAKS